MNKLVYVLLCTSALCACDDDPKASENVSVDQSASALDLETFQRELNDRVAATCKATPADIADPAGWNSERQGARCYWEFSVDLEPCEERALEARPDVGRAFLTCFTRSTEDMLDCCTASGPCDDDAIDACYALHEDDCGDEALNDALDACVE